MLANRSMPRSTVIPELAYPDLATAAAWLGQAFGFTVRVRIGGHRIQMNVGDGAVVLIESAAAVPKGAFAGTHSVMVRVENVDAHYERSRHQGATILRTPETYPYGERQYTAEDLVGRRWTFSESITDVDPVIWGGEPGEL